MKYTRFNEVRKDHEIRTGLGEKYTVLADPIHPGGGLVILQTDRGELRRDGREEVFILSSALREA
jgi:hypothetical protein